MKKIVTTTLLSSFGLLSASTMAANQGINSDQTIQPRIVGGVEAQADAWPFMSAIVSTFNAVATDVRLGDTIIQSESFNFSPSGDATGELASCGLGLEVCTDVENKICLIERGDVNFSVKADNCEAGGGVGAIIYNNDVGQINGTLGDDFAGTIPVVAITQTDGQSLLNQLGQTISISVDVGEALLQDSTCGASFLGDKWVLTAAHCVDASFSNLFQVNVGEYDLSDGAENAIDIANIYLHPQYRVDEFNYDVAVLELAQSVNAETVTLADGALTDQLAIENSMATVMGWGGRVGYPASGGETSDFPDVLHQVDLQLFTNDECRQIMSNSIGIPPSDVGVTDQMICAGVIGGGQSSCQGDSGGPLLVNTNSGWQQVGIVSWGRGCAAAGHPGVYSRVAQFDNFINAVTSGVSLTRDNDFQLIPVGGQTSANVIVTNNSNQSVALTIESQGSDAISVDTSSCTQLAAGASCTVQAQFAPTTAGLQTATLTVTGLEAGITGGSYEISGQALGSAEELAASAGTLSNAISWFSGGDAPWITSVANGVQSGNIDDAQESILLAQVEGEGTLSFDWSVSSEANPNDDEAPFDALFLFVNGQQQDFISGQVPFAFKTVDLPAGSNIVEWVYSKDAFTSEFDDAAYLRNVTFRAATPATPAPTTPPTSSGGSSGGGGALHWLLLTLFARLLFRRKH